MAAVICPKCGYQNTHGALFCEECFAILTDTVPVSRTVALNRGSGLAQGFRSDSKQSRSAHRGKLGANSIALYIEDSSEPLIILLAQQAVFGRAVPGGETQPRVDLTPYGALEKGISRQHAVIKRTDTGFVVEDLGSSNGSALNGASLKPNTPLPIVSGDRLRLSQIEIEVYLPEA